MASIAIKLRWWRDRAKPIVGLGLLVYCTGFFLDWAFELELSGIFKWAGLIIGVAGAASCFLWLWDSAISENLHDAENSR